MEALALHLEAVPGLGDALQGVPLLVVVNDTAFCWANWENFLWTVFTRSDPATDIYGVGAGTRCKHWECPGSLIMDARFKAHREDKPFGARACEGELRHAIFRERVLRNRGAVGNA